MISEFDRFKSGSSVMDTLLSGGYESRIITTFYGPSSSGKTCLCILAAAEMMKLGKKVIYIDTEGGFSVERAQQLFPEFTSKLDFFLYFKPTSFAQQKQVVDNLKSVICQNIGMIIVDSLTMFYRLEVSIAEDYSGVNRDLNMQLMSLLEIAREHEIPVLITNQVYANLENRNEVYMVGGDLLNTSKCIIELKRLGRGGKAVIKKHRFLPEGKELNFTITESGII